MTHTEKKSWKDTKLYKGNSLSSFRDNRNDAYKMSEIKKILIHLEQLHLDVVQLNVHIIYMVILFAKRKKLNLNIHKKKERKN